MNTVQAYSLLSDLDIHLFREGKHFELYKKLGAHLIDEKKQKGVYFAVWAPNAKSVNVIGSFNGWNKHEHQLYNRWDSSGIWEGLIPDLVKGETYKYSIETQSGEFIEKGDPFAKLWEVPPKTASVIWDEEYHWKDSKWMKSRKKNNALNQPYSVYEVHLGSWRRKLDKPDESLSYVEMADQLVNYIKDLNFTHVEFMPVMEHPFFGSWGYQIHGYFAPTSRFGTPGDFQYLVDRFHQEGIGVIVDWVPSHFPGDAHGLFRFDGSALYEHENPQEGFHPDWESYIFNYGRNEVRSFLISSAHCWLDRFHLDGLRVDAVASMLYRDYSRKEGEWIPNELGGRENLEAISFLKDMNMSVYEKFPDVQTIAEESTSFPGVSRPIFTGGLGFGMKWMMGWMNDTLEYFKEDPLFRRYHHNKITFSLAYAFSENFMLPLSHDEVVHGKGAIIERMPGDEWQKFANLRLLYGYMYTHPGTK
ncbi:MAG: 1,4-alpha-glucan branching protein GlgB, partial [Cytophagales bacterium]